MASRLVTEQATATYWRTCSAPGDLRRCSCKAHIDPSDETRVCVCVLQVQEAYERILRIAGALADSSLGHPQPPPFYGNRKLERAVAALRTDSSASANSPDLYPRTVSAEAAQHGASRRSKKRGTACPMAHAELLQAYLPCAASCTMTTLRAQDGCTSTSCRNANKTA